MRMFAGLFFLALFGCEKKGIEAEMVSMSEYSVLQSIEYKYAELNHDQSFILVHNALGTNYNVLAFPISKAEKGYVVMFADSASEPKDKIVPEKGFIVSLEVLNEVKKSTKLSTEVERLIRKQIAHASED